MKKDLLTSCVTGFLFGVIVGVIVYTNSSHSKAQQLSISPRITEISTQQVTNTPSIPASPTPEPTLTLFTPTPIASPTPTTPVFSYILWKSTDEIHLTVPAKTWYAISATLKDAKENVVTQQSGYVYTWTIDDKTLVKDGARPFTGCTQGIVPPCPEDHFSFEADKAGQTVIRVQVIKDGSVIAATTFPLIITQANN